MGVMTHDPISPDLPLDVLDRWILDTPTPDDRARIAAYCAGHPARAALLTALGGDEGSRRGTADARKRLLLERLASTHDGATATRRPSRPRLVPARDRRRVAAVWGVGAAALALLIGVIAIGTRDRTSAPVTTVYATATGERKTVSLPDGSHVTLAPRTELRVTSDFGRTERRLTLRGEAYFDVASARAPFVVHAGAARVDVLGTSFDVRRYDDDAVARVAVTSGKVALGLSAVRPGGGAIRLVLTRGTAGVVTDSAVAAVPADSASTTWVDGTLTFRGVPVHDVLRTLSRWYDVRFELRDSALANRHINGFFNYRSTADMLSALRAVLDVTMTNDGHTVVLHPRGVATRPSRAPIPMSTEVGR